MTPLRRRSRRFLPLTTDLEGRFPGSLFIPGVSAGSAAHPVRIDHHARTHGARTVQAEKTSPARARTIETDPTDGSPIASDVLI